MTTNKINIFKAIADNLGILPVRGKYYLYKRVFYKAPGIYKSLHCQQEYKIGETYYEPKWDRDITKHYARGYHFSDCNYWKYGAGDTVIVVEIDPEDVVTCIDKNVRVKRFTVVEEHHPLKWV